MFICPSSTLPLKNCILYFCIRERGACFLACLFQQIICREQFFFVPLQCQ